MVNKIIAAAMLLAVTVSFSSCKRDTDADFLSGITEPSTQEITRIHNGFKDVLPSFGFDSKPVENYREGVDYSFSAKCSDGDFKKYIKAVKKAGFDVNAVEAEGYYAAHTADKYYVEITLVNGLITVYVKR